MNMDNKKEISIEKSRAAGELPKYLTFAQRHLEKERSPSIINADEERFIVPVDLLDLTLPSELVSPIAEVMIAYKRKT